MVSLCNFNFNHHASCQPVLLYSWEFEIILLYKIKKSNLYPLLVHVAFHPRYSCQKFIKEFHFQRKYVFTFKYFKPYPNQPDFMFASSKFLLTYSE